MSYYKDHGMPPHFDELGFYLPVNREDRHNRAFRTSPINPGLLMKMEKDNNGNFVVRGRGECEGDPPINKSYVNLPGIKTFDDTASFYARHPRDQNIVVGALTLSALGPIYIFAHYLARLI